MNFLRRMVRWVACQVQGKEKGVKTTEEIAPILEQAAVDALAKELGVSIPPPPQEPAPEEPKG